MTTYDDLTELLDRYDVNLADQDQRLAVRAVMVWLSEADSRSELVSHFRVLAAYVDRVGAIENTVRQVLRTGEA